MALFLNNVQPFPSTPKLFSFPLATQHPHFITLQPAYPVQEASAGDGQRPSQVFTQIRLGRARSNRTRYFPEPPLDRPNRSGVSSATSSLCSSAVAVVTSSTHVPDSSHIIFCPSESHHGGALLWNQKKRFQYRFLRKPRVQSEYPNIYV
jgi:hypothetical protein